MDVSVVIAKRKEPPSDTSLELIEGSGLQYLLKRPPVRTGHAPPLLCFLHGYDESAPLGIFEGATRHGPLNPRNRIALLERLVIVAPQLPVAGDVWHHYAADVCRIVADEARRRRCDRHRLWLTGFSYGGNGVLDLAIAEPDLWAALWPVDPTRAPGRPIAAPTWLSLGELSRRKARAFIRELDLEPADSSPGDKVWSDDGEDHVGTATLAYRDARIYQWLLSKRRENV